MPGSRFFGKRYVIGVNLTITTELSFLPKNPNVLTDPVTHHVRHLPRAS